jgi:hypothetical protein
MRADSRTKSGSDVYIKLCRSFWIVTLTLLPFAHTLQHSRCVSPLFLPFSGSLLALPVPHPSRLEKSRTVKLPLSGMVSVWAEALYFSVHVLTTSDITYIDKAKRAEFEEKRKADPQWYDITYMYVIPMKYQHERHNLTSYANL